MRHSTILLIASIAILLITIVGCDNRTFEPDSYDIISLTAPDSLLASVEAEVRALVVTKAGVPAPEQTVTFKTTRGEIQAQAITDGFGVAIVQFVHNVQTEATATITATIHKSVVSKQVIVKPHPGEYVITTLNALPATIYSDFNKTTSMIVALVKDSEGVGVVAETVRFKSDIGKVTSMAVTDSSGVARAEFADNGEIGAATITAMIDQSEKTVIVNILPSVEDYTIYISASPDTIYADNNITYSTIKARVVDHENFPVIEQVVRFRASVGQLIGQVITDQSGIATSTFWDAGYVGEATIDAFIGGVMSSVNVVIEPTPAVQTIELTNIPDIMNLEQIITLQARAINTLGKPVADGTIITFNSTKGIFEENELEGGNNFAYTSNGYASVVLNTGTSSGPISVTARIGSVSSTVSGRINPGPPAFIYLSPEFRNDAGVFEPLPLEGIGVDFPNDVRVRADVKDLYDNSVTANRAIEFESTLGIIQAIAATNDNGIAYANFYPSLSAGTAQITATTSVAGEVAATGSTLIHIFSDIVSAISFTIEDEIYLDVRGTGGIESRPLRVELKDGSGNFVSGQDWVKYEIIYGPAGVNINNSGNSDEVLANNGVAVASINSGTTSGTVKVRASLVENPAIYAIKSNIVVRSGPPHTIQPFIGDFDTGTAMNGGVWRIQAGAILKDTYGNYVINGTAVHFYLGSNPVPPAGTAISGDGFVGNASDTDESGADGIAYTNLIYNGIHAYRAITIVAESGGINGSALVKLPINQPRLEVQVQPGHFDFFAQGDGTNPVFIDGDIFISLIDGQGNLISDAEILLTANYGVFRYYNNGANNAATPEILVTVNGVSRGIIRARGWEVPPPTEEYYTTVDVQMNAFLRGTNTIAQTSFTIRRYSVPPQPGLIR